MASSGFSVPYIPSARGFPQWVPDVGGLVAYSMLVPSDVCQYDYQSFQTLESLDSRVRETA